MSSPTEAIRIGMLADGDVRRLRALQALLRQQAANGDIAIVSIDDEIAHTHILNPVWVRVLCGQNGWLS